MAGGGAFLRLGLTFLRVVELMASLCVLGVFSYYLVVLKDHNQPIHEWLKAVEGMSGVAVIYTVFGVILTLCLGGVSFFGFLAVVLDICFFGCFIAIAYLTRGGASTCNGYVNTPVGSGSSSSSVSGDSSGGNGGVFGNGTFTLNLHRACRLETAAFAVSLLNIFLFLLTAVLSVLLVRHHRREKRYGPSPANNYTSGSGRRAFWRRRRDGRGRGFFSRSNRNADAVPAAVPPTASYYDQNRFSQETGHTGSTMHGAIAPEPKYGQLGYGGTY